MKSNRKLAACISLMLLVLGVLTLSWLNAQTQCSGPNAPPPIPFNDVTSFCREIAQAWFAGLTNGSSPTTYSPNNSVTRGEMAAFITRTQNTTLKRASLRAALGQFWTTKPHYNVGLGVTNLSGNLNHVKSDGRDLWVATSNPTSKAVVRVSASDGAVLGGWTIPIVNVAEDVLVAMGRVFACNGLATFDNLYMLDPSQAPGSMTLVAQTPNGNCGGQSHLAFDGDKIWMSNGCGPIRIFDPSNWSVQNVTLGPNIFPIKIIYDGSNMWVADNAFTIYRLDSNGNIIQAVPLGTGTDYNTGMMFDGTNIWVGRTNEIYIVRASTQQVVAVLTGNGILQPTGFAFDGERVLVTNQSVGGISLWRAADLSPIGFYSTLPASDSVDACADGLNFWVIVGSHPGPYLLARF